MELLKNPNFDFMKYRRFWIAVSILTILLGLFGYFFHGKLNLGVDFAGGTQLILKFRDDPRVDELRRLAEEAGFPEAQVLRFGAPEDREVMVRLPVVAGSEEGGGQQFLNLLDAQLNKDQDRTLPDLNRIGAAALAELLSRSRGEAQVLERDTALAQAVLQFRKEKGIFVSLDELRNVPNLEDRELEVLRSAVRLGRFALLGLENVGPQVGRELRQRGLLAVVGALFGMLLYIWIRFELRFAVGAIMAVLHDVIVTLGLFYWAGYEFNLTTIAGFLTLVGYSVNDTVVTFDRVRENLRKRRSREMLELLNQSINQTLSRTLLTGGTTLLASFTLYLFGGDVIRGFAFIMTVGVIVGTYSSIYIAGPFALLWEQWFGPAGRLRKQGASVKAEARA
jgi:preprotein translocase subunit SecF